MEYENAGGLTVAIEVTDDPSQKLIVRTATPHPKNVFVVDLVGIRPSDVRRFIESSLRLGWRSPEFPVAEVREDGVGALAIQPKAS